MPTSISHHKRSNSGTLITTSNLPKTNHKDHHTISSNSQSAYFNIYDLPMERLTDTYNLLPAKDKFTFSQVSRPFYEIFKSSKLVGHRKIKVAKIIEFNNIINTFDPNFANYCPLVDMSNVETLSIPELEIILEQLNNKNFVDVALRLPENITEKHLEAILKYKGLVTCLTLKQSKHAGYNFKGINYPVVLTQEAFNIISKFDLAKLDLSDCHYEHESITKNLNCFISKSCQKKLTQLVVDARVIFYVPELNKITEPDPEIKQNLINQKLQVAAHQRFARLGHPHYFEIIKAEMVGYLYNHYRHRPESYNNYVAKLTLQSTLSKYTPLEKFDFKFYGKNLRLVNYLKLIQNKPELKKVLPIAPLNLINDFSTAEKIANEFPLPNLWFIRAERFEPDNFTISIKSPITNFNYEILITPKYIIGKTKLYGKPYNNLTISQFLEKSSLNAQNAELLLDYIIEKFGLAKEWLYIIEELPAKERLIKI